MTFEAGARVRTRRQRAEGHTRLPGYLQCKAGVVVQALGQFPLADDRAREPKNARFSELYTVCFASRDVWGDAEDDGTICADLFEEYLEPLQ